MEIDVIDIVKIKTVKKERVPGVFFQVDREQNVFYFAGLDVPRNNSRTFEIFTLRSKVGNEYFVRHIALDVESIFKNLPWVECLIDERESSLKKKIYHLENIIDGLNTELRKERGKGNWYWFGIPRLVYFFKKKNK